VGKKTAEKIIENAQALFAEAEEAVEEVIEEELEAELDELEEVEDFEEVVEELVDEPSYDDDDDEAVRTRHDKSPTALGIPTRKKRGVQISSDVEKIDLDALDSSTAEAKSGWQVKAKELTDEEREARRIRQEMLRASEKITRPIPASPEPVKAVRPETKAKGEKPVKKVKDKKVVQQMVKKTKAEKKAERFVDYYSSDEIHTSEKSSRPRVNGSSSGTSKPRIELERDTYIGKITSKRRSRRNINNRQLIVDLVDGLEPDMLVGQKVYFTYPDGKKLSGSISRRFGKRTTGKVLVAFKIGVREEAIFQRIYKY
jgi:ribosomal protein L35AE/L33A